MIDIIHPEAKEAAKKQGIKPLVLGEEVTLANTPQEVRNAETLLVIGTNTTLAEEAIDGLTNIENNQKKDHTHYRKAGLDQVNTKYLAETNAAYIINLEAIKKHEKPSTHIGRIQQNIRVANKKKIPILVFTFATKQEELSTKKDLEAFSKEVLHLHQAQENQKRIQEWLKQAKKRAKKSFIAPGIKKTL